MINSIEDYELSYNLFLAEQEMFRDLAGINNTAILEGSSLIVLQEGVKETVMKYLKKIMEQIQNIWNKFRTGVTTKATEFLDKKVKPIIEKTKNISFTVDNYIDYDLSKLKTIKVARFQYNDQTKDYMQSEPEYIKHTYTSLPLNGGTDIKAAVTSLVATKVDHYQVGPEQIKAIFGFCKEQIKEETDQIAADIEDLNNSSKDVTSMVSTVTTTTEAYNRLAGFGLIILSEERTTTDTDNKSDEKMTFTDNSGEKSGESKEADANKAKITKAVAVYMSASTKLLSAKMSMVNGKFKSNIKILTHLVEFYTKNKTGVEADNGKTPTTAPQAEIKK